MKCAHRKEYLSDATPTDSDSVILTMYCPDCKRLAREEQVGSLSRALAFEFQNGRVAA